MNGIELDYCVIRGSENLTKADKKMEFEMNPKFIEIEQRCTECQECGEAYFSSEEVDEMSDKIKAEMNRIKTK